MEKFYKRYYHLLPLPDKTKKDRRSGLSQLLCEVLVVENMVGAEAVVACAAGAVAELQIGEVCVCAAADGALVAVAPVGLFLALLPHGGLELDGLVAVLMPCAAALVAKGGLEIRPEKDEEV